MLFLLLLLQPRKLMMVMLLLLRKAPTKGKLLEYLREIDEREKGEDEFERVNNDYTGD